MARDRKVDDQTDSVMDDAEAEEAVASAVRGRRVGRPRERRSLGLVGCNKRPRACAARRKRNEHDDGGATGSRASKRSTRRKRPEGRRRR
ncbi:unnamed protein product [Ixodes hexagonus]